MISEGFFEAEDRPAGVDILDTDVEWTGGYRVVYLQGATCWNAYSPDVAGVFAGGETREAAEQTMREALAFHLDAIAQDRVTAAS